MIWLRRITNLRRRFGPLHRQGFIAEGLALCGRDLRVKLFELSFVHVDGSTVYWGRCERCETLHENLWNIPFSGKELQSLSG